MIDWSLASILDEALVEHMTIGLEIGCDKELSLGLGEQNLVIRRLGCEVANLRRMFQHPVGLTRCRKDRGADDEEIVGLSNQAKFDRPEEQTREARRELRRSALDRFELAESLMRIADRRCRRMRGLDASQLLPRLVQLNFQRALRRPQHRPGNQQEIFAVGLVEQERQVTPDVVQRVRHWGVIDELEGPHPRRKRETAVADQLGKFSSWDETRDPGGTPPYAGQHVIEFRQGRKSV